MRDLIFDIQRFCVYDGPGIRTTVFFKGCNMHCAWCHNPESFSTDAELLFRREKCTSCGICQKTCKLDVPIYQKPGSMECIRCGDCVRACPHGALCMGFCLKKTQNGKKARIS